MIDGIKENEQEDFYRIYFRDQRMADYNTESVLYNFNSMGYGEQSVKSGYVDFPLFHQSSSDFLRYLQHILIHLPNLLQLSLSDE